MNQFDSACPWAAGWCPCSCAISAMALVPSVVPTGRLSGGGGFGGGVRCRGAGIGHHGVLRDPGAVQIWALDDDAAAHDAETHDGVSRSKVVVRDGLRDLDPAGDR